MPMRPASSTCSVLMKPCPSSPSSCVGRHAAVLEDDFARVAGAHAELVFLLAGATCPACRARRRTRRCRGGPCVRSVTAMTTITPPMRAVGDEHASMPLRTQQSPCRARAVVRIAGRVAAGARPRSGPRHPTRCPALPAWFRVGLASWGPRPAAPLCSPAHGTRHGGRAGPGGRAVHREGGGMRDRRGLAVRGAGPVRTAVPASARARSQLTSSRWSFSSPSFTPSAMGP